MKPEKPVCQAGKKTFIRKNLKKFYIFDLLFSCFDDNVTSKPGSQGHSTINTRSMKNAGTLQREEESQSQNR